MDFLRTLRLKSGLQVNGETLFLSQKVSILVFMTFLMEWKASTKYFCE